MRLRASKTGTFWQSPHGSVHGVSQKYLHISRWEALDEIEATSFKPTAQYQKIKNRRPAEPSQSKECTSPRRRR